MGSNPTEGTNLLGGDNVEYALCDRIGSGGYVFSEETQQLELDAYRPVIADYGCSFIAIDKQGNGSAGYWVKFMDGDITGALADSRVSAFPSGQLNDLVGAGQALFINNKLSTSYGITTNPVVAGMTWLEAIEAVLAEYDPTADFNSLKIEGQ